MPATLGTKIADAVYNIRMTAEDVIGERVRKVFTLANTTNSLEDALQAYEGLQEAGTVSVSASLDAEASGFNATPSQAGLWAVTTDMLVLGFSRVSPDNPQKTWVTSFSIVSPHPDIVDTDLSPKMVRGVTFAMAGGRTESLGALVDFLEDSLTKESADGTIIVGGWTYDPNRSGLVRTSSLLDKNPRT